MKVRKKVECRILCEGGETYPETGSAT
jgi:hypothetical protein